MGAVEQILPVDDLFEDGTNVYGESLTLYQQAVAFDTAVAGNLINNNFRKAVAGVGIQPEANGAFMASSANATGPLNGGCYQVWRKREDQFGSVVSFPRLLRISGASLGAQPFVTSVGARIQGGTITNDAGGIEPFDYYHDGVAGWFLVHIYQGFGGAVRLHLVRANGGGSANATIVQSVDLDTISAGLRPVQFPGGISDPWRVPQRIRLELTDAGGGSTQIRGYLKDKFSSIDADRLLIDYTAGAGEVPGTGRWGWSVNPGYAGTGAAAGVSAPYVFRFSIYDSAGTAVVRDCFNRTFTAYASQNKLPSSPGEWAEGLNPSIGYDPGCGWGGDESSRRAQLSGTLNVSREPLGSGTLQIGSVAGEIPNLYVLQTAPATSDNQRFAGRLQIANDAATARDYGIILRGSFPTYTVPSPTGTAFGVEAATGYALRFTYDGTTITAGIYSIASTSMDEWEKLATVNLTTALAIANNPLLDFEVTNVSTNSFSGVAMRVLLIGAVQPLTAESALSSQVYVLDNYLIDTRSSAVQVGDQAGFFLVSQGAVSTNDQAHFYVYEWAEQAGSNPFDNGGSVGEPGTFPLPAESDGAVDTLETPVDWPFRETKSRAIYRHRLETGQTSAAPAQSDTRRRWRVQARFRSKGERIDLGTFASGKGVSTPFFWTPTGALLNNPPAAVRFVDQIAYDLLPGSTSGNQLWAYEFTLEELF